VRPLADFIANGPLTWPKEFTWANFADAWSIGNVATTYRNSAILLLLKVPIGVLLAAMLAFALSKLRIRFRRTIMFAVFLGLTILIYITIVPVFVMLRSMGITDNLLGLVGPYLAFGIPFEDFRLDQRVAIVTGAGSGIGRRIATGLAEAGADVGCLDLPSSDLDGSSPRSKRSAAERSRCPRT
jgi:ABC-type glycerol-3-phosphate transport system permease component